MSSPKAAANPVWGPATAIRISPSSFAKRLAGKLINIPTIKMISRAVPHLIFDISSSFLKLKV
jgi:hypothetical protein